MARYGRANWIQDQYFRDLERFIQQNNLTRRQLRWGMDNVCGLLAGTQLSYAQKYSRGPLDPYGKNPSNAWKVPVRQITRVYYYAWFLNRVKQGHWEVGNDSREAFFIEYGINHDGSGAGGLVTGRRDSKGNRVRVRRPILKLSMLQAIRFAGGATEKSIVSKVFIGDNNRTTSLAGTQVQSLGVGRSVGIPRRAGLVGGGVTLIGTARNN